MLFCIPRLTEFIPLVPIAYYFVGTVRYKKNRNEAPYLNSCLWMMLMSNAGGGNDYGQTNAPNLFVDPDGCGFANQCPRC